jgi:hypothetical protein
MSEEEKEAIEEVKKQIEEAHNLNELNVFMTDSTTLKILLNLVDKLQKIIKEQSYTNKKMRKTLKTVRKERNKLQRENERLSQSNFHFLEINQKLIEEKPIIKELTEKELNLLEKIDKLQKENKQLVDTNKKLYEMGQQNAIQEILNEKWISKDKIINKINEIEESLIQTYGILGESLTTPSIKVLKELLEE